MGGSVVAEEVRDMWTEGEAYEAYMGRWGRPAEIGAIALFLASEADSYVNGHVLVADGGLTVAL